MADESALLRSKAQEERRPLGAAALRAQSLSPESARRLADILKTKGKEALGSDTYARGVRTLREYTRSNPDAFKQVAESSAPDPRIETSPLPTGVDRIDRAGEEISFGGSPTMPRFSTTIPPLDDLPVDHPLRLRKQRADEGVDMISGGALRFGSRANIAITPEMGTLRSDKIKRELGEFVDQVPDDLPAFRYDTLLDEFQILTPIESAEGEEKYRWTSLDGTGLEIGDMADMLDLGEIGSMIGGLIGAQKATKVFDFFKKSATGKMTQGAAFSGGGGMLGRTFGDSAGIIINYLQTGEAPTYEDMVERGWSNAGIEAFGAVTGELGAGILRGAARRAQGGNMFGEGRTAPTSREIEEANANIAQTREDMNILKNAIGRDDFAVTTGQASRSISILSDEADALANASGRTKKNFLKQQAQNNRNMREYITKTFGGDTSFLGDRAGTVLSAQAVLDTFGEVTVAQTDNGLVRFVPTADPQNGIKVLPDSIVNGEPVWQVKGAFLSEGVRDTGLGRGLYVAAKDEAERHGRVLASDYDISSDAMKMWKSLDGSEEFGDLVWNPTTIQRLEDGTGRTWHIAEDGNPVVTMKPKQSYTEELLQTFRSKPRVRNGVVVKDSVPDEEFDRFLRRPGRKELGGVMDDIKNNPYIAQELRESVLGSYNENVLGATKKDGKFPTEEWNKWKNGLSNAVLEELFTPQEVLHIRKTPGGLRQIVEAQRRLWSDRQQILADALNIPITSQVFKDPTSKGMWNQIKAKPQRTRQHVMRILDSQEMGTGVRELFKDELKHKLLQKTKAKNFTGYNEWLSQNRELIDDILDTPALREARRAAAGRGGKVNSYRENLEFIGRMMERRGVANEIKGTAAEANPTIFGLFRVVFGPLSRAQRFLTGARRGLVRSHSASVADLITDPQRLGDLVRIQEFPVSSRIASRIVQDTGVLPLLGLDERTFDADDEDSRDELKRRIVELMNADEEADARSGR